MPRVSFPLACSCSSKSPRDYLRWRLQTSVLNRENGADHSPFKILITLLAPETSCSNEFHNLITGVIWQSISFVYSKTAVWNLHWGLSRFCIVRNNEQLNSLPYIWDKDQIIILQTTWVIWFLIRISKNRMFSKKQINIWKMYLYENHSILKGEREENYSSSFFTLWGLFLFYID